MAPRTRTCTTSRSTAPRTRPRSRIGSRRSGRPPRAGTWTSCDGSTRPSSTPAESPSAGRPSGRRSVRAARPRSIPTTPSRRRRPRAPCGTSVGPRAAPTRGTARTRTASPSSHCSRTRSRRPACRTRSPSGITTNRSRTRPRARPATSSMTRTRPSARRTIPNRSRCPSPVGHTCRPLKDIVNNSKSVTMSFSGLQVCPTGVTAWSFDRQIVGSVSVSSCLEISGSVSITDGGLYVDQGSDGSSRAYVKILSGGRLTLVNSTVWSNYPLAFYVANGGNLVTSRGSALTMAARGSPGMLREEGPTSSFTISDTAIDANVTLFGGSATLVRDSFLGPGLWIDTVQTTHLWDATLTGVTTLAFTTDDGNANTVDLDIRNTTFNQVQTSQLVFGGTQNVQLTSVQTFDPNDSWWVGMITGGAQVSRYWWLHVNAVDGTGTLLADANVHILLQRLDPNTLTPFTVPDPAVDDIYFANTTTWPVSAPSGSILYRAFAESRTTSARILNNSYLATGSAVVDLTTYH